MNHYPQVGRICHWCGQDVPFQSHMEPNNGDCPGIKVLDGYVRLIEFWGHGDAELSEAGIVEAARQSTQGSFRGWENGDEKLLRTLWTSQPAHAGPFEFAGMTIEVEAPIMVFREWHRHRTQSYNEMSARYAPLPNKDYVPSMERCFRGVERDKNGNVVPVRNRQQRAVDGSEPLTEEFADSWRKDLTILQRACQELYEKGLKGGVPKELARLALTFARYSRQRASANLRNWYQFLRLRKHKDAQEEIQQYAEALARIIEVIFPRTWKLYTEVPEAFDMLLVDMFLDAHKEDIDDPKSDRLVLQGFKEWLRDNR